MIYYSCKKQQLQLMGGISSISLQEFQIAMKYYDLDKKPQQKQRKELLQIKSQPLLKAIQKMIATNIELKKRNSQMLKLAQFISRSPKTGQKNELFEYIYNFILNHFKCEKSEQALFYKQIVDLKNAIIQKNEKLITEKDVQIINYKQIIEDLKRTSFVKEQKFSQQNKKYSQALQLINRQKSQKTSNTTEQKMINQKKNVEDGRQGQMYDTLKKIQNILVKNANQKMNCQPIKQLFQQKEKRKSFTNNRNNADAMQLFDLSNEQNFQINLVCQRVQECVKKQFSKMMRQCSLNATKQKQLQQNKEKQQRQNLFIQKKAIEQVNINLTNQILQRDIKIKQINDTLQKQIKERKCQEDKKQQITKKYQRLFNQYEKLQQKKKNVQEENQKEFIQNLQKQMHNKILNQLKQQFEIKNQQSQQAIRNNFSTQIKQLKIKHLQEIKAAIKENEITLLEKFTLQKKNSLEQKQKQISESYKKIIQEQQEKQNKQFQKDKIKALQIQRKNLQRMHKLQLQQKIIQKEKTLKKQLQEAKKKQIVQIKEKIIKLSQQKNQIQKKKLINQKQKQVSLLKRNFQQIKQKIQKQHNLKQIQKQKIFQIQLNQKICLALNEQKDKLQKQFADKLQQTNRNKKIELMKMQQQNKKQIQEYRQRLKQFSCAQYFSYDILCSNLRQTTFLVQSIQKLTDKRIKRTRLLYHHDTLNITNFHKYFDNIPNIVVLVRTITHKIIGSFLQLPICKDPQLNCKAILFSLTNFKTYDLKEGCKYLNYDDHLLNIGNADLRLKNKENKVFSNFGIPSTFFKTKGIPVDEFLGNQAEKEVETTGIEVYALQLN